MDKLEILRNKVVELKAEIMDTQDIDLALRDFTNTKFMDVINLMQSYLDVVKFKTEDVSPIVTKEQADAMHEQAVKEQEELEKLKNNN